MPQNTRRYFDEAEDLLRGKSPEDYGAEFAPLMRAKIGERFKDLVTPEKLGLMALIGRPEAKGFSWAGVNFPTGLDSPENTKVMEKKLKPALKEAYYDSRGWYQEHNEKLPKDKRIFGIGAGADAGTYAHELRHEKIEDEVKNRMMDLIHGSTSLPAYKYNVQKVFNYLNDFDRELEEKTPLAEKEKQVLNTLHYGIVDESKASKIGTATKLRASLGDFVQKNIELNKAGAVGGFMGQEKLPEHVIQYRANLPFLNFVGRLGEYEPTKKAAGGAVENTTHYRKMI